MARTVAYDTRYYITGLSTEEGSEPPRIGVKDLEHTLEMFMLHLAHIFGVTFHAINGA